MAVNIGSTPISDAKLGSTQVKAIYLGTTKVWEKLRVQSGFKALNNFKITGPATASYGIGTDGNESGTASVALSFSGVWKLSGAVSDYDVQMVLHSGTMSSGSAVNTWLNLGTGRNWSINQASSGTKSVSVTLKIRDASTLEELLSIGPVTWEVGVE